MFDPLSPKRLINFRPLFIAAVGFCVGIFAFESVFSLRTVWLCAVILAVMLLICAAGAVFGIARDQKLVAVLAVFIALGAARAALSLPREIDSKAVDISGVVESVSEKKPGVLILRSVKADNSSLGSKVQVKVDPESLPDIGDRIEFRAELKAPSRRFEGYDERLVLLGDGVGYTAYAESFEITDSGKLPLLRLFSDARRFLVLRIDSIFGDGAGVVSGFLLGVRQGVDEADSESFRATGTAHLLALSGFHVMLLTSMLFLLIPKRFTRLRFAVGAAFLLFYCGIAAFSASIVRACVMCVCMLLSELTERRRDPLSSLSLAALIILVFSPYKLFSVGFLLSFAATFGIITVTSSGTGSRGILSKALSSAAATLGATAATLLITARHFGAIPLYGIAANLLIVPVFSLAIGLSFIVLVIGVPFPAVGAALAWGPNVLIRGGLLLLDRISRLPFALVEAPRASVLSIIISLVLLFMISAYVLRPLKTRLKFAAPVFLLFTASVAADIIRV